MRSRRADLDFPAEPELWLIAARLLQKVDPEVARRLLRDTEKLLPDNAGIRADFPVPTRTGTPAEVEFAQASAGTVRGALDYSGWLLVQGRWQDAQGWLAGLPANLRDRPELVSRRATLFGVLRNFDELRTSVAHGVWGTVDAGTVELAFASRLAAQREQPALARDLWRVALASAGSDRGSHAALLHLAVQLGLRDQSAQSFERLLTFPGDARATARQFAIWARQQGNPVLWSRVSQLWLEIDPVEAQAYLAGLGRSGESRKPGP